MAFELPALNFAHTALEDLGMSTETLELHHDKHHDAYVTALNGFVEKNADLQGKSLEEIITATYGVADREGIFNQAGQHWNQSTSGTRSRPMAVASPARLKRS